MKAHVVISVNGQPFDLVYHDVRLNLHNPGRASLTIKAQAPVRGLVTLDLGYNDKPSQRHFVGYIERCTSANPYEQVLFCRELAAILSYPLPLALRHVDLSAVVTEVSRLTGLRFRVGQRLQAPRTWLGSEGVNVLKVLCDLLDLVE